MPRLARVPLLIRQAAEFRLENHPKFLKISDRWVSCNLFDIADKFFRPVYLVLSIERSQSVEYSVALETH